MKNHPTASSAPARQRLSSLDALRGFDLFVLVAVGPVVLSLTQAAGNPSLQWLSDLFTHKDWEGFSPWDLIMPLFVFMSGASIPFALSRFKREKDYSGLTRKLIRRVLLLWLFGMICQGNLLGLDPQRIYLYSNTLQSIATGYLVAALFFVFTRWQTQVVCAVLMLLVYWGGMELVSIGDYGGGNYTPEHNLAEWIDRTLLGRFRDGATVAADGSIQFAPSYHYTWIWSSINFAVTAMSGTLAGLLARHKPRHILRLYWGLGVLMVAGGWLWGLEHPVIKTIWSSSMVLVSSGYCYLLLGLFYYLYDVRRMTFGLEFLQIYGMNSITAYLLSECINFRCIGHSVLYGFEPYLGSFYPALLTGSQIVIVFVLLRQMRISHFYLKV